MEFESASKIKEKDLEVVKRLKTKNAAPPPPLKFFIEKKFDLPAVKRIRHFFSFLQKNIRNEKFWQELKYFLEFFSSSEKFCDKLQR